MSAHMSQLPESALLLELGRLPQTDPATIANAIQRHNVLRSLGQVQQIFTELDDDLNGLGPLQQFVNLPGVTDVLVDPEGHIWVDSSGGLQRQSHAPLAESVRRKLANKVVSRAGKRLDETIPFADVNCGNYRFHAVLPPISVVGTTIAIRVHHRKQISLTELASTWRDGELWVSLIRSLVNSSSNFLISGATGTGKTTLLGAALSEVSNQERIVIVEDTQELQPLHPQVVSLQARASNIEGTGVVELAELIRQALRMRPDRLIVGECRGAEIRDFLTAMNTGHSGAGGTLHANSVSAVPARLVAMGALAGLSAETTCLQAGSALEYVVHLSRSSQGRFPTEIAMLSMHSGHLVVESILRYDEKQQLVHGLGWERFAARMDGHL